PWLSPHPKTAYSVGAASVVTPWLILVVSWWRRSGELSAWECTSMNPGARTRPVRSRVGREVGRVPVGSTAVMSPFSMSTSVGRGGAPVPSTSWAPVSSSGWLTACSRAVGAWRVVVFVQASGVVPPAGLARGSLPPVGASGAGVTAAVLVVGGGLIGWVSGWGDRK